MLHSCGCGQCETRRYVCTSGLIVNVTILLFPLKCLSPRTQRIKHKLRSHLLSCSRVCWTAVASAGLQSRLLGCSRVCWAAVASAGLRSRLFQSRRVARSPVAHSDSRRAPSDPCRRSPAWLGCLYAFRNNQPGAGLLAGPLALICIPENGCRAGTLLRRCGRQRRRI